MKEYKELKITADNTIPDDWINKLNVFIINNKDYKVHSILNQGHDNNKIYWKTILLVRKIK